MSEPVALVPDALLLVECDGLQMKGRLLEANDTALRIRVAEYPSDRDIPWTSIRRISRRVGRERRWWIPTMLAVVFGGLLGSIGWLLDATSHSSSGTLLLPTLLIGGLIGALLGCLIAFALPGPRWEPIYAVPEGAVVAPQDPLASRLAGCAVPDEERQAVKERGHMQSLVAWAILAVLIIIVLGWCNQNFR